MRRLSELGVAMAICFMSCDLFADSVLRLSNGSTIPYEEIRDNGTEFQLRLTHGWMAVEKSRVSPEDPVMVAAAIGPSTPSADKPVDLAEGSEMPANVRNFFQSYCYECHGPDEQKAKVRFDTLGLDFADEDLAYQWTEVVDVLEFGEMPPQEKPRPPDAQTRGVIDWVGKQLKAAQLAAASEEGRTVLRRLNRLEYENTVNELLGTDLDLQERLPQDGSRHGFNKVGEALGLSTELMQKYLETTQYAVKHALEFGEKPQSGTIKASFVGNKRVKKHVLETDGGTVLFGGYSPTTLGDSRVREPGIYEVTVPARAHASNGRGTYMGVFKESPRRGGTSEALGYFDVRPGQPQEFRMQAYFNNNERLKIAAVDGPSARNANKKEVPGVWVGEVTLEGPLVDEWPPARMQLLLGDLDLETASEAEIRELITRFAARAFRRPLNPGEETPFVTLASEILAAENDPRLALETAFAAVLCSPHFILLDENPGELDDFQLASRLSYFLWNTMPDEQLLEIAAAGRMKDPAVISEQVERMLDDPRSESFVNDFTDQWLMLDEISATSPDRRLYPEFSDNLQDAMVRETRAYFRELLDSNLPATNVVDSDFAMLNRRLAEHYGIDGIVGHEMQKVKLPPDSARGGFLTQASVLKVTANGSNTSPVLRGVFVLDNIVGDPADPPPPGVGALEPDTRGATTIREQLTAHREDPACMVCHQKIDPPGFALESFDVIGGWQDRYRSSKQGDKVDGTTDYGERIRYRLGLPVEAGGELPNGKAFSGVREFKKILADDPDQLTRALAEKLVTYSTGSAVDFADREALEQIVAETRKKNYGVRSLVHHVTQSPLFQRK